MRIVLCLAVLLAPAIARAESFVYLSLAGENKIAVYSQDESTGELKHARDVNVSGGPGSLAVGPSGRFLFASIRSVGNLASFRIDENSGGLEFVSEVSAGADPAYVAVDRSGRFLFSAYYRAGKVTVHRIGVNGELSPSELQSVDTDEKAHAILTDPANRFAYVPHTGPNAIFQFAFNAETGRLSPAQPAKLTTPDGYGPRHIWFHPKLPIAYADNEQGSSLTVYKQDQQGGALAAFQTLSTLPADFKERNSCADVEVHPSGWFVYVSNRGHDSIAGFAVDQKTGNIKSLGQTPTEQTPRSFNIDPSGKFLYAAGQGNGKLAAYHIDEKSGALERFATYEVGRQPWWVLAVRFE